MGLFFALLIATVLLIIFYFVFLRVKKMYDTVNAMYTRAKPIFDTLDTIYEELKAIYDTVKPEITAIEDVAEWFEKL
jgi:hypothetical protein